MNAFSFRNERYREKLTRQVIHMDQGVCYNPEYLATRHMHDYPSRVAQIVRAVLLGELNASCHGAETVFRSILSGQGERWQNFGEAPDDYLLCLLLGRELFVKKGFARPAARQDFSIPDPRECRDLWESALPVSEQGSCILVLDDASFAYAARSARKLGEFLSRKGIGLAGVERVVTGFAAMAHGYLEDGATQLARVIEGLNRPGIAKALTVSAATHWALGRLADALGLARDFELVDILDCASAMEVDRAYIYGGSFYTRYLGRGPQLEQLTTNTYEIPVPNAPEFLPLYDADKRLNGITLFGAPICAEYVNTHTDKTVRERIRDNALDEIRRSSFAQLVVCEPFAYKELTDMGFAPGKLRYFLDVLA